MSEDTRKVLRAARLAAILILAGISIKLITHSVTAVSYPVGKQRLSELAVTELSLTHTVLRGPDGKLYHPYETPQEPEATRPEPAKAERVAQPEPAKSTAIAPASKAAASEELAAKKHPSKAKPKKPAPKKPSPRKPKPKKPPAKPKGGSQACPT